MISKGAKLDHIDNNGQTFLNWAVHYRLLWFVQFAIQKGIDVNCLINKAHTALTSALSRNVVDISNYLIENGADVFQCDQNRNMSEELVMLIAESTLGFNTDEITTDTLF